MPIYEYRCKDCHQIFEEWVRQASDDAPRKCPVCDGDSERVMSSTSFVLNGDGWYVTDYGYKSKDKTGASASAPSKGDCTPAAGPTPPAAGSAPASSPAPAAGPAPSAGQQTG